jgi:hypothetical protein
LKRKKKIKKEKKDKIVLALGEREDDMIPATLGSSKYGRCCSVVILF